MDGVVKSTLLTGAGGVAFCAGADLKAIETFGERLAVWYPVRTLLVGGGPTIDDEQ
jgi:enoyl-CoA hydratase/carnithine racemase